MDFRAACAAIGREPSTLPVPVRRPQWEPAPSTMPVDQWQGKADTFTVWAHSQLLHRPDELDWLARRGIGRPAVQRFFIGWNPGERGRDIWRQRSSWGLAEEVREDTGKPRRLWLPRGLVIPSIRAGYVQRLRIRRPEGEPRYYVVPGSGNAPLFAGRQHRAAVVVESELDALALAEAGGDLAGAYAIGNSSAKPDAESFATLRGLDRILIATDFDEPDHNGNRPGTAAARWWLQTFPQAIRWPVPAGKDPGEAFQEGVNLREWIVAGLTRRS
jgi:hypothetical protein